MQPLQYNERLLLKDRLTDSSKAIYIYIYKENQNTLESKNTSYDKVIEKEKFYGQGFENGFNALGVYG